MTISVSFEAGGRKNGKSSQYVDCLHTGDTDYTATTGIDVSTTTFEPLDSDSNNVIMTGMIITEGSGNIAIEMEMGGVMTVAASVSAEEGHRRVFDGFRIKKIFNVAGGTSFSGNIFPLW
mgnify:CR=1 FL=1